MTLPDSSKLGDSSASPDSSRPASAPAGADAGPGHAHVHGPACDHDHDHDHEYDPNLLLKRQPMYRTEPKVGRNDPCPCGNGKKYKKCHGA